MSPSLPIAARFLRRNSGTGWPRRTPALTFAQAVSRSLALLIPVTNTLAWILAVTQTQATAQSSQGLVEVRIRGDIRRIQPMSDGSFVLGGFTAFYNGTPSDQLYRVLPSGTRVPFPVTVNGSVQAMALGENWLYLGGDFQVVNGVSCPFVARVDAGTGTVDRTWRPAPNGDLIDLVPVPGGVVISGAFSQVGGLPRSQIALVSSTGAGRPVETWRCDADGQVDRLLLHEGWIYAGGRFKSIGGRSLSYLARLSPGTGAVDPGWNPTPNSDVYDLAADNTHLYAAGSFSRIGFAVTPSLARIPLNSTAADATWAPFPDSLVTRLCVSGDSVYAAGNFTTISGLPQKYIARIPKVGGTADATWKPPIDGGLLALAPDGADGCWGGGRFDSGANGGSGFARFTRNQGSQPPAYPARIENRGAVKVIQSDPTTGGWLCGGDFDTVNGLTRHALFRLRPERTLDTAWDARLGGFYTEVNAMDILPEANAGGNVLIGGQFEVPGIGGELLYNCLLLKLASGQVVPTFHPQPSGTVRAIVREAGTWLLGGNFQTFGQQQANFIARIRADGNVDPFFAPSPNGPVHTLLKLDGDIYLGGEFTSFTTGTSATPVPYLARLNNLAPDLGWQPRPDQAVFALASDGNRLYAGGRFTRLARARRRYLAELPLGGAGTPTAWNPAPDAEVNALRVADDNLYVGGAFFAIDHFVWPKLAHFYLPSLELDTDFHSTGENGAVYAIEPQLNGDLLVGGSFTAWDDDDSKRSLVAIRPGGRPAGSPTLLPSATSTDEDLLADYFAPDANHRPGGLEPLPPSEGIGLRWRENRTLPYGLVARVQWSTDLITWHESGDTVQGTTRFATIEADGIQRTARLDPGPGESDPAGFFLRLTLTPGGGAPAKRLQ